ncbi:MAG: hypothetical protein Q7U52_09675 [Hydrogenophaga sp.]|uniref:hypothetical protein n=1 Tax=Hydrogenophaga sp. TaxID=1904254 RepID=UPI00272504F4|nr:hypothetical protein [Hydrogenophaga sp.]MDO9147916.1 hypothetical protein [Hydrogenophaga sp.]MDO9604273.1 hypothetical protein [Hydrogenophaga sp.]MDP3474538.1 hypothetical protein [Hydrogenophaga sp.]
MALMLASQVAFPPFIQYIQKKKAGNVNQQTSVKSTALRRALVSWVIQGKKKNSPRDPAAPRAQALS